jgi:hypothetical protein
MTRRAAEQLGISQLMDAEDLVAGGERLSNITQLSEYVEVESYDDDVVFNDYYNEFNALMFVFVEVL